MVLPGRFELPTSPLPRECSTPELRQPFTMKVSSGYRRFCKDKLDVLVWVMYGKFMGKSQEIKESEMTPKEKKVAERTARLRKQLRDNLQRRKQQTRGRDNDMAKKA